MTGGYDVDPDELTTFAGRLDESADEVRVAAAALEEPLGDLGPEGITSAVEQLIAEWAGTLRGAGLDAVADGLRAVGETYRRTDGLPRG
ncbi:hypothetical protein [Umezawaea sp. Da 62-37]|uniref:WXG100 family type VII secretion target n=1 Tax=Umezawaea sp. Da 62-37 TaxID=3075927 RepID=UPI0028F7291D|nr:hypothetical protein [Umezawaea sp. Da 62-37]WNV85866.1 hypothetical protein RM788_48435 [Umezawaea sp. Da 62-37]